LLVAALANEAATERVQIWLERQPPERLLISDWVVTEFASALSIEVRTGTIRVTDRARIAAAFTRLRADSLTVLSVTRDHFVAAALYAEQFSLGLRAADALHLAIAAERGATICTLDKRLSEAAMALAVNAELYRAGRR
jgi:predicted nucleic acid-binding protein